MQILYNVCGVNMRYIKAILISTIMLLPLFFFQNCETAPSGENGKNSINSPVVISNSKNGNYIEDYSYSKINETMYTLYEVSDVDNRHLETQYCLEAEILKGEPWQPRCDVLSNFKKVSEVESWSYENGVWIWTLPIAGNPWLAANSVYKVHIRNVPDGVQGFVRAYVNP